VLQPVVVRHGADGEYELVVGERRWRAAQRAGRATLPVVVADVEPRERLELALVENVQRQDLNPIELAHAFRTLAEGGATQEEVGGRLGIDRSTVANHLRLLELARSLQEDVERGRLSVGHAKALLQVANPERRLHLRDAVVREGLSVRETERRARSATPGPPRSRQDGGATGLDPDTKALVDRLRSRLQTQVRIVGSGKRGRIEIEYFSGEDLERLVSMLEAGA
jgi:ParB family chromosome partitioning protein